MKRGVFITGTNTNVGKTWVGTQLAQYLCDTGVELSVKKPIESGCEIINNTAHPKDALAYQPITQQSLQDICPYPLKAPLSPQQAMQLEGKTISLSMLINTCHHITDDKFLLVEGAGGVMSPIASDGLNLDLARALNIPVVLTAINELGCINHVLLAEHAIKTSELNIACIVMNHNNASTDFSLGLEDFSKFPIVHTHQPDWLKRLARYTQNS